MSGPSFDTKPKATTENAPDANRGIGDTACSIAKASLPALNDKGLLGSLIDLGYIATGPLGISLGMARRSGRLSEIIENQCGSEITSSPSHKRDINLGIEQPKQSAMESYRSIRDEVDYYQLAFHAHEDHGSPVSKTTRKLAKGIGKGARAIKEAVGPTHNDMDPRTHSHDESAIVELSHDAAKKIRTGAEQLGKMGKQLFGSRKDRQHED